MRIGYRRDDLHIIASKSLGLNNTILQPTLMFTQNPRTWTKHSPDLDKLLNNTLAGCKAATNFSPCHVHLGVVVKNQIFLLLDPDRVTGDTRKLLWVFSFLIRSTPITPPSQSEQLCKMSNLMYVRSIEVRLFVFMREMH